MKSTKIKMMCGFIFSIAGIFFLTTCTKFCVDQIKKPANIPAVDWDDYNDVYTVFWNYYTLCSEAKKDDSGKDIMIIGWIYSGDRPISTTRFSLTTEENRFEVSTYKIPIVGIRTHGDMEKELQTKLDTCDLSKKCFIKGKLVFRCEEGPSKTCSKSKPEIFLENIENIYFE